MKRLLAAVFGLVLALGSLGCGEQGEQSEDTDQVIEDIVAAHPEHATVAFENDQVQAVVFSLAPGSALPLHEGGPRAIYALSDYTIEWTEDGQVSERSWSQGDVHWHDAADHAIKNTGESDARYLVVSRKAAVLPAAEEYDGSQDAAGADPTHATVIMENHHVRVVEVNLPPGAKQPIHSGAGRLVYSLTPYEVSYTTEEGGPRISSHEAGDAHWHAPEAHAVENVGETPARFLIFAFKR